jgi:hypothetical protein
MVYKILGNMFGIPSYVFWHFEQLHKLLVVSSNFILFPLLLGSCSVCLWLNVEFRIGGWLIDWFAGPYLTRPNLPNGVFQWFLIPLPLVDVKESSSLSGGLINIMLHMSHKRWDNLIFKNTLIASNWARKDRLLKVVY